MNSKRSHALVILTRRLRFLRWMDLEMLSASAAIGAGNQETPPHGAHVRRIWSFQSR